MFNQDDKMSDSHSKIIFYIIFAISGFSGLIYESIWSHYLKLFLGHAAYAQTLVLIIFMGGMALGAWLVSKFTHRIYDLLKVYALVEIAIGVMGLLFHDVYVLTTDFTYDSLIPSLTSVTSIEISKWCLAALLILPQSILLGSTFPLMSAGIIRKYKENSGQTLALLYFSNSIGAVAGVLVSGFLLIKLFGLPGTIQIAAFLNLLIAAGILIMGKLEQSELEESKNIIEPVGSFDKSLLTLILICASFTGLASFIYEIGWIRMLSLVLGSSTHAFELMLSAFILGLAIGGFWVKKHIDKLSNPIKFLGFIQLIMGGLALSTLFLYNGTFDYMATALKALDKTEQGYWFFNIFSHALAMLIMLPATICAGMTLPLITHILLQKGYGERSIGMVYSMNTLGAIFGVVIAVQVLMPFFGLKNLIVVGGGIDVILGLWLLWYVSRKGQYQYWRPVAGVVSIMFVIIVSIVELDALKMASGVYRSGRAIYDAEILYHKDGKTASVDLLKFSDGTVIIGTNGKTDASLNPDKTTADEPTMSLAVALPMDMNPSIKNVAVIGFGSGLSTQVVLSNPNIESVDTIEIEPAMVEAAKGFGERVNKTYTDPRSHIYIEDAKTFFTSHNKKYDLIMSEPSNPWVSGIASLFSQEFYKRVQNHLSEDGLFVQWLHMYEVDKPLMASVVKALDDEFKNYKIYFTTDADILFIASNSSEVPELTGSIFTTPGLKDELSKIQAHSLQDLQLRYLGDKNSIAPLFLSYPVRANSDYYPWVDLYAVQARYMETNAYDLVDLITAPFPLIESLGSVKSKDGVLNYKSGISYKPSHMAEEAAYIFKAFRDINVAGAQSSGSTTAEVMDNIRSVNSIHYQCSRDELEIVWLPSFHFLMERTIAFLSPEEMNIIFDNVKNSQCYSNLSKDSLNMIALFYAVINQQHQSVVHLSNEILVGDKIERSIKNDYVLKAAMLSNIALNDKSSARKLWARYSDKDVKMDVVFRLINSHAGIEGFNLMLVDDNFESKESDEIKRAL